MVRLHKFTFLISFKNFMFFTRNDHFSEISNFDIKIKIFENYNVLYLKDIIFKR